MRLIMSTVNCLKECSVPNCQRIAKIKGWCMKHYSRQRRTGSLELKPKVVKIYQRDGGRIKEDIMIIPTG